MCRPIGQVLTMVTSLAAWPNAEPNWLYSRSKGVGFDMLLPMIHF